MSLTLTVTAGKQFAATEALTIAKLNQLGLPTITGTANFSQLADYNAIAAASKTFTYTGALDQLTATAHGIASTGATVDAVVRAIVANAGGTLPTGLVASTTFWYYVRVIDANTVSFHTTAQGAIDNSSRVIVTAAGSGTHTMYWSIYSLGVPLIYNATTSKWELGELNRVSLPEALPATASANGARGAVPQPVAGDQTKFLRADMTWQPAGGGAGGDLFNTMIGY